MYIYCKIIMTEWEIRTCGILNCASASVKEYFYGEEKVHDLQGRIKTPGIISNLIRAFFSVLRFITQMRRFLNNFRMLFYMWNIKPTLRRLLQASQIDYGISRGLYSLANNSSGFRIPIATLRRWEISGMAIECNLQQRRLYYNSEYAQGNSCILCIVFPFTP